MILKNVEIYSITVAFKFSHEFLIFAFINKRFFEELFHCFKKKKFIIILYYFVRWKHSTILDLHLFIKFYLIHFIYHKKKKKRLVSFIPFVVL